MRGGDYGGLSHCTITEHSNVPIMINISWRHSRFSNPRLRNRRKIRPTKNLVRGREVPRTSERGIRTIQKHTQ